MGGFRMFLKGLGVFILESLAMVLAAFVASLAFPSPFDDEGWGWIAFVSLVPVFYVINRTRWSHAPFLGLVYGFMFYIFYNYWLSTFHPLAILIAPILESVQYMVLFPVLKSATSLFGKRSYVVQTFFYVAYLYLTQQGFLGYPYGNLSSAVTSFRTLIQIADITGIWGICLVMTLTQTLAAKMLVEHGLSAYYVDVMLVVSPSGATKARSPTGSCASRPSSTARIPGRAGMRPTGATSRRSRRLPKRPLRRSPTSSPGPRPHSSHRSPGTCSTP